MPPRPAPAAKHASAPPRPSPAWLPYAILALTLVALLAMFSDEITDSDTWFHLMAGQWMVQTHRLPIPDPFGWTTYMGTPLYAGEYATRDLNLKHEWLSQVVEYLAWALGGLPGMVVFRALCVAGFCAVTGWIAWRRTSRMYLSILAALLASTLARSVAVDRPYIVTYLLLAIVMLILERRKPLWVLPPIFIVWANLHGGYFIGWVVLGAYCGEALIQRLRKQPPPDEKTLWAASLASILASAFNPAFYGVIPGLFAYRRSLMQSTLREWHPPAWWPPGWHVLLAAAGLGAMLWAWRRVRPADWLLFGVFLAAALMASRNLPFLGLIAPIAIATYLPKWARPAPRWAEYAFALGIAAIAGERIASGHAFQMHAASWKYPDGAVRFLKEHNVGAPMFNLYEWGGYLMWAAWPQQKTFVDGRALNESVFRDYLRLALTLRYASAKPLLDKYGVEVALLEGFEYGQGTLYWLAVALADPAQDEWKLVYQDNTAMLFMRRPPPGVQPLPAEQVFASLEAQCSNYIQHEPAQYRCARGLGDLYARLNRLDRAAQWLEFYLSRKTEPDPDIDRLYSQIRSGNFHAPAIR